MPGGFLRDEVDEGDAFVEVFPPSRDAASEKETLLPGGDDAVKSTVGVAVNHSDWFSGNRVRDDMPSGWENHMCSCHIFSLGNCISALGFLFLLLFPLSFRFRFS